MNITPKINVAYIASREEVDRVLFMEEWLANEGLPFERSNGVVVDNAQLVSAYDVKKRLDRYGFGMTASEVGCFLAHRNCWLKSVKSQLPLLVLESDVRPATLGELGKLLVEIEEHIDTFDMVRLHGIFERNECLSRPIRELSSGHTIVQTLGDPMGAGAYIITPHAAAKLLQKSESFYEPLDVFISHTWFHKLRFRGVKPYPFQVADFPSVIGEDRRRPSQNVIQRLRIELNRASDDLKRVLYMPTHFFR